MINILTLIILLYVLYLQIVNFWKYKVKNGANRTRIILFISVVCLAIHVVRLMLGITNGFFLVLHVVTWLVLYEGDRIDKLKKFLK